MSNEIPVEGARAAFEKLKPALDALTVFRRGNINLQRIAIAAAAQGRRVRLPEIRERLSVLHESVFDVSLVDLLEPAAQGLWYALVQARRAAVSASEAVLAPALVEAAAALKARMLRVLEYHLGDDRAVRDELDSIIAGAGHMDTAMDLARLARLYEEHAAKLAGDTVRYDAADAASADRVSDEIVRGLGEAEQDSADTWSDYVIRAWTLVANTYDEVSAAGRFVFRHEGGEEMFPSLIAITRTRRTRAPVEDTPVEDAPVENSPALPAPGDA